MDETDLWTCIPALILVHLIGYYFLSSLSHTQIFPIFHPFDCFYFLPTLKFTFKLVFLLGDSHINLIYLKVFLKIDALLLINGLKAMIKSYD